MSTAAMADRARSCAEREAGLAAGAPPPPRPGPRGRGGDATGWICEDDAATFAAMRGGARLAAASTRSKADEAAYVLSNSGAKALIFRPAFLNIDYGALLEGVDRSFAPARSPP